MKKCSYCGKLSGDGLAICSECGTPLPKESFGAQTPHVPTLAELRARRKAVVSGTFWMILCLGVLPMGWLYPAWFFGRDPIMQRDPDPRIGPAVVFSVIASIAFAVVALRSFRNARKMA